MNLSRTGWLTFFLLCTMSLTATTHAKKSKGTRDCWQTAMSQYDLDQCAGKHAHNAQGKLDSVYKEILKEYAKDLVFIKALQASQKAWLAYRDAQIKMAYPHADESGRPTVIPMCEAQYRGSLTKARTKQLERWLEGSPEGDVCAGSIKYSPKAKYAPTVPLEDSSSRPATACQATQGQ